MNFSRSETWYRIDRPTREYFGPLPSLRQLSKVLRLNPMRSAASSVFNHSCCGILFSVLPGFHVHFVYASLSPEAQDAARHHRHFLLSKSPRLEISFCLCRSKGNKLGMSPPPCRLAFKTRTATRTAIATARRTNIHSIVSLSQREGWMLPCRENQQSRPTQRALRRPGITC
jgi:hypothetical protein